MDDPRARLAAALSDRYTIEGQAGQGGMATVYRATDLKHHRQVAIKVLRPELSAAIGGERFLQEIQLSAKLQHPHIVPLYDSGDAGGTLYYVMPFIEGESLRDRITRTGKLPFEEAVTLIREVASALGYAHERGIVHRDIKPENIMLSGGHAVVADFGIARALDAAQQSGGSSNLTGVGFAIGTPAYMSPEQATASDVDARSDQYSLACVFYEMVTGNAPFAGHTVQAVLSKSLTGPRPKLSKVERATPPEADATVARALDADPTKRFASVTSFAAALEHAAGGGAGAVAERRRLKRLVIGLPLGVAVVATLWILFGPQRTGPVVAGAERIAVMPFSTSGAGVELMGEGMVDLLSTNLNTVGGIQAADPRAVLARWKKLGGSGADLQTALKVASGVNASAALVGSIVATGGRVRVSADLYGQDGKSLSHAQVDGAADSVLSLVDDLSLALVRDIWRSKEPVPSLRVSGLTTNSLGAMRDYLVGEQHYRRSEWDSAAAAFGRAIDQDSTFALAHYRLAATIGWSGGLGAARGKQASDAAVRFGNRLPDRERSLVYAYNLFEHQKLAATDSMRAYMARYPDDIDGWFLLGESQYHTRQLVGYDAATMRAPFDSVLARDASLTPAAIHPLEIAVTAGDRARYESYLQVLDKSGNAMENMAYRGTGVLAFGNGDIDSATARAMIRYQGSLGPVVTAAPGPEASSDSVLQRFGRASTFLKLVPESRAQFEIGRGITLASLGQFNAAREVFDSARKLDPNQSTGILMWPQLAGFAPPGERPPEVEAMLAAPRGNPFQVYLTAMMLLNRGNRPEGARLIDSLLASDSTKMPPQLHGLLRAVKGWTAVMAGDTVGGLARMRSGLADAGAGWSSFLAAPVRLQFATLLATRPDSRAEGLRLLNNGFDSDLGMAPIVQYALGRAQEAAGNRVAAAEAYSRFLRLWDKADASAQPRITEVKEALQRVTGETK